MSVTARETYQRHRLSMRDYQRMGDAGIFHEDERVELIEGEIVDMALIGTRHASCVKRLANIIKLEVGEGAILSVQDPVTFGDRSVPQPDIALLRPRDDYYAAAHPQARDVLLIIEVAETSLEYDRDVKLPLYARHAVPEVWLVDVVGRKLTVYRDPAEAGYRHVEIPAALAALAVPGVAHATVNLEQLF